MSYKKSDNGLIRDYEEYTTSRGLKIKVHAVPQPIIRAVVPNRPKPELPTVDMKIAGGATQKRPSKTGDPNWDVYKIDLDVWEQERDDLQEAITFCMALKEFAFPPDLALSPELAELVNLGFLKAPDNPYIRKFMWLRENVLGQHDEYNINMIIHKLSGVPEDIIDEMKRNFRNILLGQTTRTMGEEVKEQSAEQETSV